MNYRPIPVKTHIITEEDDIVQVIARYAMPLMEKGDIITVAETVVAITQGRFIRPDYIKPSLTALLLSRFIAQDGSLSSPYAMELVMREEGKKRLVAAFLAGSLAHLLLRRSGVFYRLAGDQAALVDDVTGTMPPYDKYIVLGPKHPERVVANIKKRLGVEAAIIDANDLGRSRVVAATPGVRKDVLEKIFARNPAGNDNQQTPLVILKKI